LSLDKVYRQIKGVGFDTDEDSLASLGLEIHHTSLVFPSLSDLTVTFTAPVGVDTYSVWAEIVDSGANTLSNIFAADDGHLSAVVVEVFDTADKNYIFQISYGAAKVIITTIRFHGDGAPGHVIKVDTRTRGPAIPAGETVYYRMMCETGSATCLVSFRYHIHT